MKVLYAAGRNTNARIQLSRFLEAIKDQSYIVKVSAFQASSPKHLNVDWTLDCLLDMFKPEAPHSDNNNFSIYYDQIKRFKPDLIISDLEHFTSHVANLLNIPLWQCSSSLINRALSFEQKKDVGLFARYSHLLTQYQTHYQWQSNIIGNSDRNFVYSHFGDTDEPPALNVNFEWIRPYHQIGKKSIPCQHNIVAGMLENNKRLFELLRQYPDSVAFTEFRHESHQNFILKDISNRDEYFCNLANSKLFLCQGETSFLADAFYNGRKPIVMINFNELECVINGTYSEHYQLSHNVYEVVENIQSCFDQTIKPSHNNNIKYLHERLGEV